MGARQLVEDLTGLDLDLERLAARQSSVDGILKTGQLLAEAQMSCQRASSLT
jgi:hypothetical protein